MRDQNLSAFFWDVGQTASAFDELFRLRIGFGSTPLLWLASRFGSGSRTATAIGSTRGRNWLWMSLRRRRSRRR